MLALPKRVGIRPNGAFLHCPHPRPHNTFLCASCLSALRADVTKIYPALSFNHPCGLHSTGSGRRTRPAQSGPTRDEGLPEGWVNCPASPCLFLFYRSNFLGKPLSSTIAHKASNTAFHSPGGVTDTTRPAGGAHKPSQGPTQGFTVLSCCSRYR